MNLSDLTVVEELKLRLIYRAFLFSFLEFEIVASCDVVVFVRVDALEHMVFLKAELN